MKILKFLPIIAFVLFAFTSCSDDDDGPNLVPVEAELVTNVFAPQTGGSGTGQEESGEFTKFNFATGTTTTSDTDWDIAFRGLRIIVNGGSEIGISDEPMRNGNAGVYFLEETLFDDVTEVDESLFAQDSNEGYGLPTGSDNGWYNYSFTQNIVTARSGIVLVFRTRDNRYAKVQILSYYQDNPTDVEVATNFTDEEKISKARYYNFNYVYQPNEGVTTF